MSLILWTTAVMVVLFVVGWVVLVNPTRTEGNGPLVSYPSLWQRWRAPKKTPGPEHIEPPFLNGPDPYLYEDIERHPNVLDKMKADTAELEWEAAAIRDGHTVEEIIAHKSETMWHKVAGLPIPPIDSNFSPYTPVKEKSCIKNCGNSALPGLLYCETCQKNILTAIRHLKQPTEFKDRFDDLS